MPTSTLPSAQTPAPDKIDQRILQTLLQDGRISHARLAEAVHLSPSAVQERVKRLQRDGVILGYQARLNREKLGMGVVAFIEVQIDRTAPESMHRFTAAVQACPAVLECHLIAGGFDFLLKVLVADMQAYRELVATRIRTLPGVRDTRTYAVIEQAEGGDGTRAEPAMEAVDTTLLRLLQADGRISITRLAQAVGLTPTAVHERVARLRARGYILGYVAVLNEARLHSGLLVFGEVRLAGPTRAASQALTAALQACHDVVEFHHVAGNFDLLVKVRVPDMQHYRALMNAVVWSQVGVHGVRTYVVVDEIKKTARIPL